MAPFNNTSALKGLDSDNVSSLRRLMNAIMHRLAGVPAATIQEIDNLSMQEHATMLYLSENARDNELLSRMVTRFASARYANSNTVREAGRELDLVVTEAVLEPHNRPERELVMAEGFFNHLVAESPATYGAGAENEYGEIESDEDDENDDKGKKDKKDSKVTRKRTRSSNTGFTASKRPRLDRPRMGHSWSSDVELQDDDFSKNYKDNASIADSFRDEEYNSDGDMKSPDSKEVEAEKKRHTAKRKHGEICVPDPNISRDNAVVGQPDASKCSFTLQTQRPDPKNPGNYIPSNPILFEYPNPVNWDDKISVSKLNSWRYQVFKRTLGQKRESRPPWTVNEQNKLVEIVQSHLNEPSIGGRFSQIDWNELERRFNAFFDGKSHLKGESTAETSYNVRGKDMVAKTRKLAVDREHLPRSAGAIENQLTHFTDPLARAIIAAARKADDDADSDEDTPVKGKGKGKAPAKRGLPRRKPKKAIKVESEDEDITEEEDDEDEDSNYQDRLVQSKRDWDRENRDRRSGESSKGT